MHAWFSADTLWVQITKTLVHRPNLGHHFSSWSGLYKLTWSCVHSEIYKLTWNCFDSGLHKLIEAVMTRVPSRVILDIEIFVRIQRLSVLQFSQIFFLSSLSLINSVCFVFLGCIYKWIVCCSLTFMYCIP